MAKNGVVKKLHRSALKICQKYLDKCI